MSLSCVLVVEDNRVDQFICTSIIEQYDPNIKILQAYDGQEALEILGSAEQKPDLIFLDINMPRMNGHEFLEAYDKEEEQAAIVVMLTSSSEKQDKEKSMGHECVKKYCEKPLTAEYVAELSDLIS